MTDVIKGPGGRPRLQDTGKRKAWTKAVCDAFFEELAASANVRRSARAAGMSQRSADSKRRRDAEFRARWREAVAEATERLNLVWLERAMNGKPKTVTAKDGTVTRTVEYPQGVALALIRAHRPAVEDARACDEEEKAEAVRRRIAGKLERLAERLRAERAEAEARKADEE